MTSTPPIGSLTPTTATPTNSQTGSATGGLDQDAFMKLLVAQLKYQDPSKPADSSQFMSQTAQFTLVEKMEALVDSQQKLAETSQLASATGLVGSRITYLVKGQTSTGVVTAVSIADGVPTLMVGDTKVDLSQVSKVEASH